MFFCFFLPRIPCSSRRISVVLSLSVTSALSFLPSSSSYLLSLLTLPLSYSFSSMFTLSLVSTCCFLFFATPFHFLCLQRICHNWYPWLTPFSLFCPSIATRDSFFIQPFYYPLSSHQTTQKQISLKRLIISLQCTHMLDPTMFPAIIFKAERRGQNWIEYIVNQFIVAQFQLSDLLATMSLIFAI